MNETLIDNYLLNRLTPDERISFEDKLASDVAFQKEFAIQKEALKNIEELGRIELKNDLKSIHKSLQLDSKKSTTLFRSLYIKLAAAAAFVGFLTVGWWIMNQSPSCTDLYSANFEPYEINLNQRSTQSDNFATIEDIYNGGNFEDAIPLLTDVLKDKNVNSSTILLGLGISYLETNQNQKAIDNFNKIIASKDFNYVDEAQWYLCLTYLKMEDVTSAKKHLSILANDASKDHHQSAKNLLSQLPN